MALLTQKKFDFASSGLATDTFGVVRFGGSEGFSRCYRFEIDLVSTEPEIDLRSLLRNPATFTILREDGDIPFHGMLAQFDQLHQVDEYVFYRAVLVPRLWWVTLTHHNQVFLDKSVPEILQEVLKDGGLTSLDFDLRLQGNYPKREYVCQYRESHLDFLSRWMEREGMYYYFGQNENGEKLIITDTRIAHSEMDQGKSMYYSPPSALDEAHREEVIKSFVCRQTALPRSVRLQDYNCQTPSLEMSAGARVSGQGRGEVYIYGDHFRTPEEGSALAKVCAEELLCKGERFYGESTIPYLRPGYLFDLQDHYRHSFNQSYLTIELEHEGSQAAYLLAGIRKELSEAERQPYYRNSFAAIPGGVQFRPERKTAKALFSGAMNAQIDAAGSGQYAELDDQGRYKVLLPFDRSGGGNGKGSTWLRMAQPYAGADHGMHFPLHKGTEVLLTFVDGDPDRPIIAGAVPNPETPSPVTSENATRCRMVSGSGNEIHMEDEAGSERILMNAPRKGSFIRIGAPNDPIIDWDKLMSKDGIALATGGFFDVKAQVWNVIILGESASMTVGNDNKFVGVLRVDSTVGARFNFPMLWEKKCGAEKTKWIGLTQKAAGSDVEITANNVQTIGGIQRALGSKVDAAALDSRMNALKTRVATNYTAAITAQTRLIATKSEVSGAKTDAAGQATTAAVQQSQAIADEAATAAQDARLAATRAKSSASEFRTVVKRDIAAASRLRLRAERTVLTILDTQV
ncbi:MAG: type VI secretion system tip protein VgrG [Deltaproteobacteria bacterium HGW-Deltaproteobacteria-15]|jgi:type VI secretion system secreted protein VgrG|nr:MAG: type VI secretion system tip protein VgrG [Deltaproteobacteria bacterium HGW-Deltaproteobacteria-15]